MSPGRRVASLAGPLLYALAAGAVAVAAGGQSTSRQPRVLASSVPTAARFLGPSAPSCPLSLAQQVKSVKAFAELMPVFRHPRCANCHGGVNPFTDAHRGGAMDPELTREQCQDCHAQLKDWDTPGPPMFFVGRSDEKLCLQIKEFSSNGNDFVEHIRNDHEGIQFIAAGFKGDRALDSQSLKDHDVVIAPPPGTQEQLTEKARKWVKAMGGDFVGPPECGCVKPKIELKMKSEWSGGNGREKATSRVSATVPLEPDSGGLVFKGIAPLVHGVYSMTAPPGCRADIKPSGGELEVTEARFDVGSDQRMTISLAVAPTQSGGTWTYICPEAPMIRKIMGILPVPPWAGHWQLLHQPDLIGREYHFDEFEAASGLSLAGERKLVGRKEVTRSVPPNDEGMVWAKTTFEFWWVGLETPTK